MAQDASTDPRISLTAKNEPLGDVLETISRDTGYRFNLDRKWQDHPISAAIDNLPLEQGIKRLLRSLNYSIVWESDRTVTIMVFGKADPSSSDNTISFSSPPQTYQEEAEPTAEIEDELAEVPEPAAADAEAGDSQEPGAEEASTPETENPSGMSAADAVGAGDQSNFE